MAKKPNAGGVDKAEAEARRMELGALLAHWPDEQRGNEALKALFESEAGQAAAIRTVLAQSTFLDDVAAYLGIRAETPPERWRAIALKLAKEKFPAPKRRGRPEKITTLADHYAKAKRARGGRPGMSDEQVKTFDKWIPKFQRYIEETGGRGTRIAASRMIRDALLKEGFSVPSAKQVLDRAADLKKSGGKPKKK
jgi:hypothetical protein